MLHRLLAIILLSLFFSCSHLPENLRGPITRFVSDVPDLYFDKSLRALEYPFPVKFYEFEFRGRSLRMAYMDIIPPEDQYNGMTVVFFHGKNFNGLYWEETARSLSQRGFRVIIPDQIGFGKSSKPLDYPYSFHSLAFNTDRLLTHLGVESSILISHSMGGMLASRFALMYPRQTQLLVMVNPIGLEDWRRKVPYIPFETRLERALDRDREDIVNYQKYFYYAGQWNERYENYASHLIGWAQGPDRVHMAELDAHLTEMILFQPVLYEFDLILAPTFLILGERDRTALGYSDVDELIAENLGRYDRFGVRTCNRIPRCHYEALEDLGHLPHIEDFERFDEVLNRLLTFLH